MKLFRPFGQKLFRPFEGGIEPPVDPISGFTFFARLQTHRGDNIPIGLYQENSFDVPATQEGDQISMWADEISDSGVVFDFSYGGSLPFLTFIDGVPCVAWNGLDNFAKNFGTLNQPFSCWFGCRIDNLSQYRFLFDSTNIGIPCAFYASDLVADDNYAIYAGAEVQSTDIVNTDWHSLGAVFDGNFSSIIIDDNKTPNLTPGVLGLDGITLGGRRNDIQLFSGLMTSAIFLDRALTNEEQVIISNYIQSINP